MKRWCIVILCACGLWPLPSHAQWYRRAGACGSPVLNSNNEVIGVHIGSTTGGHLGFVVPAAHLQQLLLAYHQGSAPQPLVLNGTEIGNIQVNEYVSLIYINQADNTLYTVTPYHREASLDYAHLENSINTEEALRQGADRLIFIIQRAPFSSKSKDKKLHAFKLTYYLETGETTWQQDDSYATIY